MMTASTPLTIAAAVDHWAAERPDFRILTVEGGTKRADETRTYAELAANGRSLAAGLLARGMAAGDRVATLLANHAEFVDLMVAAALTGIVLVPIDPRTRGDKLVFMIEAAGSRGVIAADYALPELLAVRPRLGETWIAGLPTDEGRATDAALRAADVLPWSTLAAADTAGVDFVGADPDSAMELIYTSGTTGDPKGIVMTHRRYCDTSRLTPMLFGLTPADRLYSGLSLTHANAQIVTLGTALMNALPCVLSRRFTKSRLWDITRQHGCTTFTLLGGMTTALYAEPPLADDAENPVRLVIAAGMPAAIWDEFQRRFAVRILEFYGAAEGGLVVNPPGVGPVGSIGRTAPHLAHRIVDDEGRDVAADGAGERVGEILFRPRDGTPARVEYYGNPQASADKCADGWLRMGDVVREDKDGWLYFLYRKGSGIRRNGDFINPAFIEKAIAEAPEVDDVYVYGIPSANGVAGEKDVVAAVVPRDADLARFDAQALFRRCRAALESNFVPSFIQVLPQIPKTASEKPQDRFLIEAMSQQPDGVHTEARG